MRLFAPDEIPWEEVRTQQHVAAAQLTADCAGCSASDSHEMAYALPADCLQLH